MKGPGSGQPNGNVAHVDASQMPASMTESAAPEQKEYTSDYNGYEPPPGVLLDIDRVSADISPEDFFARYVAKRKPVVIKGHPTDQEWKGHLWTNQYLKEKAGNADVQVEQRGVSKESTFGLMAPKIHMNYGTFLDNVMQKNDRLYMTTQDLERFEDDLDDHDMPKSVVAEPLRSLSGDYPIQPPILGNLIPYQLSLWQGIAKSGTSSGLHHDYHDNMYVLLRGRKRFRLFAPSAAAHMRTAGILAKIHSNGLIVYRNKPDDPTVVVRSDGVPFSFLVQKKKDDAEKELSEAEESLEDLLRSSVPEEQKAVERQRLERKIEECEARIDEVMDEMILYCCPGEDIYDSGESEAEHHLVDDDEPVTKRQKVSHEQPHDKIISIPVNESRKMPDHFCDMSFPTNSEDPNIVFTAHPHLKQAGCIICELDRGEMLYLPASWFHEVTSYSENSEESSVSAESAGPTSCGDDSGHLAFNYWMYPPDHDQFQQPYKDAFWSKRWERILQGSPLPIQHVWSSDDEEYEGEEVEEEDEVELPTN